MDVNKYLTCNLRLNVPNYIARYIALKKFPYLLPQF